MSENNYPAGFFFNLPREGAPSFVKGSASIRPDVFIEWLKAQHTNEKGYVKLQFKEGREGKGYASLDTYGVHGSTQHSSPQQATEDAMDEIDPEDIPF